MKNKKFVIVSLLMVCVIMIQPLYLSASGITPRLTNGHKWATTPKYISFTCDFSGTAEREAVMAAMSTWNAVKDPDGNTMVSMQLTTGSTNNSIILHDSYIHDWAGYCDILPREGVEIDYVTIYLNAAQDWSTTGASDAYDIQTVVTHELGHALGVAHCHEEGEAAPCWSATCTSNVMRWNTEPGEIRRTLQPYDTASYIRIYW